MREKGFALPLVLIGVVIGVILLGTGFFLYNAYQLGKLSSYDRLITPSPKQAIPSSNNDETANWEVYTNSDFGYQIRYPENWSLYEFKEVETVSGIQQVKSAEFKSPRGVEVEVGSLKLNKEDKRSLEKIISEISPTFLIKNKLPLTFLGLPALRLEFEVEVKGGEGSFKSQGSMLAFKKDDTLFEIILFTASPLMEESLKTFDQMVKTFKFTQN